MRSSKRRGHPRPWWHKLLNGSDRNERVKVGCLAINDIFWCCKLYMANASCQTLQFIICPGIPEAVAYIGLLRYCSYNWNNFLLIKKHWFRFFKKMDNWFMRYGTVAELLDWNTHWSGNGKKQSTDLCTVGRVQWFLTFLKGTQAWYFKPSFSAFIPMNKT